MAGMSRRAEEEEGGTRSRGGRRATRPRAAPRERGPEARWRCARGLPGPQPAVLPRGGARGLLGALGGGVLWAPSGEILGRRAQHAEVEGALPHVACAVEVRHGAGEPQVGGEPQLVPAPGREFAAPEEVYDD